MCDATDITQIIYDCAPSTTTREKVGVDEKTQRFFDVDPAKLINQRVYEGGFFSADGVCVASGGHYLRPQLRQWTVLRRFVR